MNDIVGVFLVECEDKRLGQIVEVRITLRVGKHLGIDSILVCLKDEFDLRRVDDAAVQFLFGVFLSLGDINLLHLAGINSLLADILPLKNSTTMLGLLSLDAIGTASDIHMIGDRLLQRIVDHTVLVEVCECLRCGSGCKTNLDSTIEIVKDGTPTAVNGTVALVYDDKVEVIAWQIEFATEGDGCRFGIAVEIRFRVLFVCNGFAVEKREQALNGRYNDVGIFGDMCRFEPFDSEDSVERVAVLGEAV